MSEIPSARSEIADLEGYHSPQVEVDVRLNTNESPVPPPVGFFSALADAVRTLGLNRYPDRAATSLRSALAHRYSLDVAQVFCGNGSNEVLQTVLLAYGGAGRTAAVFEPTYALHAQIARATGTRVVTGRRDDDFALSADVVRSLVDAERPDVVFLCSPNNPTGTIDAPEVVPAALESLGEYGGLLVVDEAYGQFSTSSAVDLLGEDRALVVSRTFSKTWALAGLRLGYLMGPSWCLSELDKVVLPYHLDAVKQAAGVLALGYAPEMEERVAALVAERERVTSALRELPVVVWPSAANFVLFRPGVRSGSEVWQGLLERSILVRDCSSWDGLAGCLRVTIGTEEEDDRFLVALRELLREGTPEDGI
ncbi:MAG: histidinol-phosphate transaminase [Acidimicrobiales bacterium]|nr:histidinol-phosphate transaminase [Acidimicrobiales bacterium]MDP6760017.1 histidinol-phosphate transaminase [Acidimicrobiales bacterium]